MLGNLSGHNFGLNSDMLGVTIKLAVGLLISMKCPMTLKSEKNHNFLPWTSLY